jgi:hypothetical protein
VKLSTKVRLSSLAVFICLLVVVLLHENFNLAINGSPLIVFFAFILQVIFFVRLKCEKCGCSVYQCRGEGSMQSPYSYIVFKGKCPCCKS